MLKLKNYYKKHSTLKCYITHNSKYSSGVNPQVVGDNLKSRKANKDIPIVDKKTFDDLYSNPLNEIQQSMSVSPLYESGIKKLSESMIPKKIKDGKLGVLPFDDVPGPQTLKFIANFWKYIPAAGAYFKLNEKIKLLSFLFDKYGPLVRVVGPFGGDVVLISRPEHMQSVFDQEGPQPIRSAFDSLEHYRLKNRNFDFPGIYSLTGEEWSTQRTLMEGSLKHALTNISTDVEKCSEDMISTVPKLINRHDEMDGGVEKLLFRWSIDCMGYMLLSENMGLVEGYESPQGDALWLEEALSNTTTALASCEMGMQMWKVIETPSYKKLVLNCNSLDSLIGQYIKKTEIELQNKRHQDKLLVYNTQEKTKKPTVSGSEPRAFIKTLLLSENMKSDDILTALMDMLIVGVNSTTSAMSFLLYHLSKSQRAQNKLFQEIQDSKAKGNKVTYENIKKLPYLQACIKESLRLVPPFPVITRILPKNIILDSYKIPHGTTMVMAMQVSGLKEENFDDSKRFYPERWLKTDFNYLHPLASLPFGYGSRKCIGQGLAEVMLYTLTAKIIDKYKVEYNYGEVVPIMKLISMPNTSLRLRFIDRD